MLKRSRWLDANVIDHPIHAQHLIDDAVSDAAEEGGIQSVEVDSQAIGRDDGLRSVNNSNAYLKKGVRW